MVDGTSHMFITGPEVIKTVTNEDEFDDLVVLPHAKRSEWPTSLHQTIQMRWKS